MRISDWSSDVCSSDLIGVVAGEAIEEPALPLPAPAALPQFADQVVGKVVAKLVGRGRDQRHLVGGDSRFLAEFAQGGGLCVLARLDSRSEEHTSELQSLMRISYAVFCLKTKNEIRCRTNKKYAC